MKRGDRSMLILTVALFAVCLLMLAGRFFFAERDDLTAVISQNGRVLRTIRLKGAKTEEFTVKCAGGGWNRIRVADGKICMADANCPDRDCVKRGLLGTAGDSSVCLPHRLEIRLSGTPDVDGATY
jgi:hypothetical protein